MEGHQAGPNLLWEQPVPAAGAAFADLQFHSHSPILFYGSCSWWKINENFHGEKWIAGKQLLKDQTQRDGWGKAERESWWRSRPLLFRGTGTLLCGKTW